MMFHVVWLFILEINSLGSIIRFGCSFTVYLIQKNELNQIQIQDLLLQQVLKKERNCFQCIEVNLFCCTSQLSENCSVGWPNVPIKQLTKGQVFTYFSLSCLLIGMPRLDSGVCCSNLSQVNRCCNFFFSCWCDRLRISPFTFLFVYHLQSFQLILCHVMLAVE